jgi:hypothetical protein
MTRDSRYPALQISATRDSCGLVNLALRLPRDTFPELHLALASPPSDGSEFLSSGTTDQKTVCSLCYHPSTSLAPRASSGIRKYGTATLKAAARAPTFEALITQFIAR